uniref:Uncharacterized protein n=1 Tax=Rhizophora mucronata TaxID=61149 RepID=A0A2P2NUA9_RHIMU
MIDINSKNMVNFIAWVLLKMKFPMQYLNFGNHSNICRAH